VDIISTIAGAANYLGISEKTIYRAIKSGKFPAPDYITELSGGREIKSWKTATLDGYKGQIRPPGNPNFRKKSE
jgi:predicted DNA-binding transcriptional regulator AlpA